MCLHSVTCCPGSGPKAMKRSLEQMQYGEGWLVHTNGSHTIASEGGQVELGGRTWFAKLLADGKLELTCNTSSTDAREKVNQRATDMKNEVVRRKEEADTLARQQQKLLMTIEQVCSITIHG